MCKDYYIITLERNNRRSKNVGKETFEAFLSTDGLFYHYLIYLRTNSHYTTWLNFKHSIGPYANLLK